MQYAVNVTPGYTGLVECSTIQCVLNAVHDQVSKNSNTIKGLWTSLEIFYERGRSNVSTVEAIRPSLMIPMEDINFRVYNVRGLINPQECVDLARRIKEEGLNNPVEVVPVPEGPEREANAGKPYKLFAGFRRYMAHRINGATHIEAKIYEGLSLAEQVERNFTENSARSDLTFMQEARGLAHMKNLRSYTYNELADRVGKSSKWCQIRLWATELEPEIQKEIEAGYIKTNHIEELKALPMGEPRYAYVRQVKSQALKTEKPRVSLKKKNPFSKRIKSRTDVFELQDHIIEQFGGGDFRRMPEELQRMIQLLGWAAGEATDMEVYGTLRKLAEVHKLHYEVPENVLSSMQG